MNCLLLPAAQLSAPLTVSLTLRSALSLSFYIFVSLQFWPLPFSIIIQHLCLSPGCWVHVCGGSRQVCCQSKGSLAVTVLQFVTKSIATAPQCRVFDYQGLSIIAGINSKLAAVSVSVEWRCQPQKSHFRNVLFKNGLSLSVWLV